MSKSNVYDTVIIGSGFGGSVSALRICEAYEKNSTTANGNKPVLLLERGKDWWGNLTGTPVTEPPFSTYRQPDARAGWMVDDEPLGTPVTFTPGEPPLTLTDSVENFNSGTYAARPIKKYPGLVEAIPNENMTVLVGAALGGTSHVYNTFFQKPSPVAFNLAFRDPEFPDDLSKILLDYNKLGEYYDKVTKIIKLETITNAGDVEISAGQHSYSIPLIETDDYLSTRSFEEQARNLAKTKNPSASDTPPNIKEAAVKDIQMAFNWQVVAQEAQATMLPSATIGEMWYGMNSYSKNPDDDSQLYGVKKSLDQNYLKLAQDTGNLEIQCLSEVTGISMAPNSTEEDPVYYIYVNQINETDVDNPTLQIIKAKNVILSAGSMHTSRLLLESANTPNQMDSSQNGLPPLSPYVGQYWGQNGDVMGTQNVDYRVRSSNGGPGSVDAYYSYVEGVQDNTNKDPLATEKACLDFMKQHKAAPFIRFLLYPAWYEESDSLQNTYNMTVCHQTAPGSFVLKDGQYKLDYPLTRAESTPKGEIPIKYTDGVADSVNTLVYTLDKWNTANSNTGTKKNTASTDTAKRSALYYSGAMPIKASTSQLAVTHAGHPNADNFDVAFGMTAHPLGSCVIGKACDGHGRLMGKNDKVIKGLYVVDGSLIPGSTGACTPAWTIAALAEYCMANVAQEIVARGEK